MGKTTNVIAAAGMALAAMSQTSMADQSITRNASTDMAPAAPSADAGAKQAADRFLAFVVALNSTSDLTRTTLENAFQVRMRENEYGHVYISDDLGGGWEYSVARYAAKGKLKQAFEFGFYNSNRSADPSPVCVIDLARLRSTLIKGGFTESVRPGEIGGIVSIDFYKNDLVVKVLPREIMSSGGDRECIRLIGSGG